jgi:hypothetical protein
MVDGEQDRLGLDGAQAARIGTAEREHGLVAVARE